MTSGGMVDESSFGVNSGSSGSWLEPLSELLLCARDRNQEEEADPLLGLLPSLAAAASSAST